MAATPRSCSASFSCIWSPRGPARSAWNACSAAPKRREDAMPAPDLRAPEAASSGARTPAMPTRLKPLAETPRPIDAGARIGHVHLKVADLDRALGFYTG